MMRLCTAAAILSILPLFGCGQDYKKVFEQQRERGESVRLYKFTRQATDGSGKTEWLLSGEEAYLYKKNDEQSKIVVYNFRYEQYDPENNSVTGTLTSVRGEIDYETGRVRLKGGVKYVDNAGRTTESEALDYNLETKIITSDVPVVLKEGGRTTNCLKGVYIDRNTNREICKGPSILQLHREDEEEGLDELFH
jgi:LPS export ABC transporter protein LptC